MYQKENSLIRDSFSASSNTTKTYTRDMNYISLANDHASTAISLAVNGLTISVKAGETFAGYFAPFSTFTITASVAFRCLVGGE